MWDELGIAPSADPKVIRRAYAVRHKALDPDCEPTAFARLRDACARSPQLLLPGRKHLSLIGGPPQMVRAAWHRLTKRRAA